MRAASLALVLLAGCASETLPVPEAAPMPAPKQKAISMTWQIESYEADGPNVPVADAELCLIALDGFGCATVDGELTVEGLPAGTAYGIRATREGFLSELYYGVLPSSPGQATMVLIPNAFAEDVASKIDVAWPQPDHGVLQFSLLDTHGEGLAGVTPTIDTTELEGPFFFDADGVVDPTLTATSDNGGGFYTGLVPGDYEMTLPDCYALLAGLEGSEPSVALAQVEAATRTNIAALCMP